MDEVTTAAKGHQQMPDALPFRLPLAEGGVVDLALEFVLKCHPERSEGPPYG